MKRILPSVITYLYCSFVQANTLISEPGIPLKSVSAIPEGHNSGHAKFIGHVVASPCSLSMSNPYQSVNFSSQTIPSEREVGVHLNLHGCELTVTGNSAHHNTKTSNMMFDGLHENHYFIALDDDDYIKFQLKDENGNVVNSSRHITTRPSYTDGERLNYKLHLLQEGKDLRNKNYHSTLRFTITYQ
ncbi:hypothetical protein DCI44_001390 [Escherichia coli]|nr:hypothetical protein [Escherichia coli]EFU8294827.1 hypothetical protein [Escherichia coli]EHP6485811.1 hypothetical protein [Escherichia coli]EIN0471465.1 hypothetical protein [Escherichia coli]